MRINKKKCMLVRNKTNGNVCWGDIIHSIPSKINLCMLGNFAGFFLSFVNSSQINFSK